MALGDHPADRLAHDLTETEFDAVERDGLRATWTDGDSRVVVSDLETGETVAYDAEDLFRATSDTEVYNARTGAEDTSNGGGEGVGSRDERR